MKLIYPSLLMVLLTVSCVPAEGSSLNNSGSVSSSAASSVSSVSELTSSELALLPAKQALYTEQEKSFNFFWETTTTSPTARGFGLSRDRWIFYITTPLY
jgi:hypothetical protein